MDRNQVIIPIVLGHCPDIRGVYLFGSCGTGTVRPDSDVDLALLLPHEKAKQLPALAMSQYRFDLEEALQQTVDLVNARHVSTVLQKEIIFGDLIFFADRHATDEFEMLSLSY